MTIRNVEIQCEILRRALDERGHHVHILSLRSGTQTRHLEQKNV